MNDADEAPLTLDPPGTIAVIGAGVLGIEAALYGRFLGYDVILVEAESVGHSIRQRGDEPLPMLPDRCLSPLAFSALGAQSEDPQPETLPVTCREWVEAALVPLSESDLLLDRLRMPSRVVRISTVSVEAEEGDSPEDLEDIPDDFRLHFDDGESLDVEAVIVATGAAPPITKEFETPADYFFVLGNQPVENLERALFDGLRQIVELFAGLAGRVDLDLYLPKRH